MWYQNAMFINRKYFAIMAAFLLDLYLKSIDSVFLRDG